MGIAADRQAVVDQRLDAETVGSLREAARQAAQSALEKGVDSRNPRNYALAMDEVEQMAKRPSPIAGADIRAIHGLIVNGLSSPTPYRNGQSVIRDSTTSSIVYLPPEAKDVPVLMAELVVWINRALDHDSLPAPIIAALAHYQFATIRPYVDGNGRTAHLVATLVLHRSGFGLDGIYSVEERTARDRAGYLTALAVGPSHNYSLGRAEADVTKFVDYFCRKMGEAFAAVRTDSVPPVRRAAPLRPPLLRQLDPRRRRALELFRRQGTATTGEIANHLGLSPRTVVALCRAWRSAGFLSLCDPSRKNRSYRLASDYEQVLAEPDA